MTVQIIYEDDAGTLRTIDLMELSEKHGASVEPTDSPVEDGSAVTDGVRVELDTYSCKVFVTNAGLTETTNVNGATRGSTSVDLPSGAKVSVGTWSTAYDRPKSVYDEILALQKSRRRCSIVTALRVYDEMVLTSMSAPVDAYEAIEFELAAREVRVVQTQSAAAVATPRQTRAQQTMTAGQIQASVDQTLANAGIPPPAAPTRQTSVLSSILGGG